MTHYTFLCRCGRDRLPDTTTCGDTQCAYHRYSQLDPGKQRILLDEAHAWLIANRGVYVARSHRIPVLDRLYDGGFPQFLRNNQDLIDDGVTFIVVLTHVSANLPLPIAKALDALVDDMLDELARQAIEDLMPPSLRMYSQARRRGDSLRLDAELWEAIARLVSPPCQNHSQAGKRPERPEDN
jgi:hypothetical protein